MKQDNHTYYDKLNRIKKALLIEILLTFILALTVIMVGLHTMTNQAEQYASDVEASYEGIIDGYITAFNTITLQLEAKIAEDPSLEEMNVWLQNNEKKYKNAIGEDVYDGIAMTYKGGYAHSWNYGDYSDYDPNTRPWYQKAQKANGKVAVVAPYVTYLDTSELEDDEYILMTITRKYNDEISFDLDLKILGIEKLLTNRDLLYSGSHMMMFDPDGYVLSSNKETEFAHNVNQSDDVISESLTKAVTKMRKHPDTLHLSVVDGKAMFTYASKDQNGNVFCNMYPVSSVALQDFLAITLVVLFMVIFEIWLYRKNKISIFEFKRRDDRISAVADAVFQQRLYVDLSNHKFYGNSEAKSLCPDRKYEELFQLFCGRIEDEAVLQQFKDFVSMEALDEAHHHMYKLQRANFPMQWKLEDGTYAIRTIEVGRLASDIDGQGTVAITCRDVSEDAAILKDALTQAEHASKAKGDFMSRMSHEIRTPLNAIIGYLDIARDEQDNPEKMEHCIEKSQIASRHLLSIINDVLDVSSIESGRMKIEHADFDIKQMVNSLTTVFYAQAKEKKLKFAVKLEELDTEWLVGDELRVRQILLNLLSNAVKFTPEDGSVTLGIRQIGKGQEKIRIEFRVSDTGIGMSEEYRSRMFTPFEQEKASTAKNYGGTGLGLSICHNLVEMMGGTIKVKSTQGEGTTFVVLLAFDRASGDRSTGEIPGDFSQIRALVVDDDKDTCDYMEKLLGRIGIKCDLVTSGKKAIRRVVSRKDNGHPYDLCIIDWYMQGMNGMDTAREVRKICGKEIPIIIATAYDYTALIDEAKEIGVDKIVSKPLFQSTLFDLLVSTYGKYKPVQKEKAEKIDLTGTKILLAEDNEMNMEIALDILGKAGLIITPVKDGQEAVNVFEKSEPGEFDAILMDIQMPVMDGYTATRTIRASGHPEAKSIPIIAMTANAFTEDVTAALSAGMNDHVAKPISYDRLFQVLNHSIKKNEGKR